MAMEEFPGGSGVKNRFPLQGAGWGGSGMGVPTPVGGKGTGELRSHLQSEGKKIQYRWVWSGLQFVFHFLAFHVGCGSRGGYGANAREIGLISI